MDRERIEREADAVILAWYHNDTHDRTHVEPESRSGLVATVTALVLRERAAVWEKAARACREALEDERKVLNAGAYIEACMELENRVRALAAQERAT